MALSGHFKHFPKAHLAGLAVIFFTLFSLFIWPSNENQTVDETSYTVPVANIIQTPLNKAPEVAWESTQIKSGDSLSSVFGRNNLNAADVLEIVKLAPKAALRLQPGQTLRWVRNANNGINQFEIILSPLAYHAFTRKEDSSLDYQLIERDAEYRPRYANIFIENSLFVDGLKAGVPDQVLFELASIFGWDIDLTMDLRQGDSFSLIYDEIFLDGEQIGNGHILTTEFSSKNRHLTAVRYTDKNGKSDYYTPEGFSMRKEFLRNPIDFTRISSRFSVARKHPVLQSTIRAHKGTDYAAPTGTPIKASGDGKIVFAGRKGGYGNAIIIQHGARYQTLYGHLSKFNRNTKTGRFVKQGQVIGYVGMTGLATGPHLHYEFRVNGVHRDPLTAPLPKAKNIASEFRADFHKRSQSMLSWLASYNQQAANVSKLD